jgi:hypothetical protein
VTQHLELKHGQILHAGFTAPIQELLGSAAVNFRLQRVNGSTIKVAAAANNLQVGIAVSGKYRWRTTEATASLPGGLANGEHPVFVTASANDFTGPLEEPDKTTHTFGLEIKKAGESPSTTHYREVGKVTVTGGAITSIRQTVEAVSGAQIEAGALAGSGDLEWTRDESGGWVPQLKANSVGSAEIAADAVGSSEIAAGAVGESELATDAVTPAKIGPQTFQTFIQGFGVVPNGASGEIKWTFGTAFTSIPLVFPGLQLITGSSAVHLWADEITKTYATFVLQNAGPNSVEANVMALATVGL